MQFPFRLKQCLSYESVELMEERKQDKYPRCILNCKTFFAILLDTQSPQPLPPLLLGLILLTFIPAPFETKKSPSSPNHEICPHHRRLHPLHFGLRFCTARPISTRDGYPAVQTTSPRSPLVRRVAWSRPFSDLLSLPAPEDALSAFPMPSLLRAVAHWNCSLRTGTPLPGIPGIPGLSSMFIKEHF